MHKHLSAVTRVDGCVHVLVIVVIDVAGAKAKRRTARAKIQPIIVGVGDTKVANVLISIAVAMSNKTGLVMIVEVCVRDGDEVSSMGCVDQTVVVILIVVQVAV